MVCKNEDTIFHSFFSFVLVCLLSRSMLEDEVGFKGRFNIRGLGVSLKFFYVIAVRELC